MYTIRRLSTQAHTHLRTRGGRLAYPLVCMPCFDQTKTAQSLKNAARLHSIRHLHTSHLRLGMVTFKLADIGEGIAEVEMLRWHKAVGDQLEEMEGVCEVQSDKAAVEITSRYSGVVKKLHCEQGDIIKIGSPLMDIETEDDDVGPSEESTNGESSPSSETKSTPTVGQSTAKMGYNASPAVRALAKKLDVDLSKVQGTGKGGRVAKEDIEAYVKGRAAHTPTHAHAPTETHTPPTPTLKIPQKANKEVVEVPIRGFVRAMVKTMAESVKVPHMNIGEEVDVTELVKMKETLKGDMEKEYGIKLTITTLIIKAVSLSLLKYPILNSKIHPSGESYSLFGAHNISMAVDTSNGLVVPNIKNVEELNIVEIQSELIRISNLARANKLTTSDLTGGTVSISNVGVVGGTYVKAIIFDGQAMILGIGRTQTLPRFDSKMNVVPRDIMTIAASVDHRHIDGATVARFMKELKLMLESPARMLLQAA